MLPGARLQVARGTMVQKVLSNYDNLQNILYQYLNNKKNNLHRAVELCICFTNRYTAVFPSHSPEEEKREH